MRQHLQTVQGTGLPPQGARHHPLGRQPDGVRSTPDQLRRGLSEIGYHSLHSRPLRRVNDGIQVDCTLVTGQQNVDL